MWLSNETFTELIKQHRYAAVLFSAKWASKCIEPLRPAFSAAKQRFEGQVGFGEIDIDEWPDIANSLPVGNVPTVAYYKDGHLVAALIGANQKVAARIEALMQGKKIGYRDGHVADHPFPPRRWRWFLSLFR